MSSITHEVYHDLHLLICTWSGVVTDAAMLSAYRAAYSDPRWAPGFNEVTDLRRADVRAVTGEGLRRVQELVADTVTGFTGTFRTAVLAPTDLAFGLSRMYEMMAAASNESVRVCRDIEDAAAWVGVPVSALSPSP